MRRAKKLFTFVAAQSSNKVLKGKNLLKTDENFEARIQWITINIFGDLVSK